MNTDSPNTSRKYSSKFHCAGVMSFDFGDDPIYKEFTEFISGLDVLKPAKVFGHAKHDGRVDEEVRVCSEYGDIEQLVDKYPVIDKFTSHFYDLMEITSQKYMDKHQMSNLDAFDFLQVLHYTVGGKYVPHVDQYTGDREVSCIIYLNNVEEGGETFFPNTYNNKGESIKIKPKPGRVLLFQCGHSAIHAGLPVIKGTKMVIYTFLCQDNRKPRQGVLGL